MRTLESYRNEINSIDTELVRALSHRFQICGQIAKLKKTEGIPMMQRDRVAAVLARCSELAAQQGMNAEFVTRLYRLIIDEGCRLETEIMQEALVSKNHKSAPARFVTLGPAGSCHENAACRYLQFHGLKDAELRLCTTSGEGLDEVYADRADYLIQCSAHLDIHLSTEKYFPEIQVTDTFMYPTKNIALLENAAVERPETLGLVKATEGYLGDISYSHIIYETTKPVVGAGLLAAKYDAGLTYYEYYLEHPGRFRLRKYIGPVLTTWLVFGRRTAYEGTLRGIAQCGFYNAHGSLVQAEH